MSGFDEAWAAAAVPRDGEPVSSGLRPLILRIAQTVVSANGWRTSELREQESRGSEDRGRAMEVTIFRWRTLA